ncbi:sulfatase family protein [Pontiella sulfatireligans]|uniref:Arylsulfatase n=1 Tax=Pontiella sulfatireligans TaxID=2750658 RepID=A0A6C2UGD3_9BACT|nr:sulfatase [Pontiella sulfatireligans]SPS74193.1 sulfatase S1_8 [Kiritimatiellales bacterium]VGO18577.1 Arylsulfatase [Pontiella sulfatireligans]
MKSKHMLLSVLFATGVALLSVATAERPNIVLLLADDISQADIGCYGHPVIETPNIDQLAAIGVRFDNCILTTSSCTPSRCSIITGRYPHNTGAPELKMRLPADQVVFPKLLKDAGYYTVLSGKNHMGDVKRGFDLITNGGGGAGAGDWVELLEKRPKDKPFFCWYATHDAHRDWSTSEEVRKYKPEEVVIPPYMFDGPKTREDLTGYYHEVSRFDYNVGRVVAELKRQGVFENTLIFVTADNGRPFPRSKTRLYDSGIKPPFIVHYPPAMKQGVSKSFVSSIDIAATALDVAGLPKDERIQGVSFASILLDHTAVVRELAIAEHNWHVFPNHERSVRFGDWLYIRNNKTDQQNLCAEAFGWGAGEELWDAHAAGKLNEAQSNIFWNPCPEEELYNVVMDSDQLTNVAMNPENKPVMEEMRRQLLLWTEQTGDTVPVKWTGPKAKYVPPGFPTPGKNSSKRGDIPGAAAGAEKINNPGPIKFK